MTLVGCLGSAFELSLVLTMGKATGPILLDLGQQRKALIKTTMKESESSIACISSEFYNEIF